MSGILGNAVPGAGGSEYTIDNSLRFRNSASAYLSRTAGTPTSQKTWTYSAWIKRGKLGNGSDYYSLLGGHGGSYVPANYDFIRFQPDDTLIFALAGGTNTSLVTTQVFRDPSAWYHILVQYDSTQATSSNRAKIYVNGSQITSFSTATYPAQNTNSTGINASGLTQYFGALSTGSPSLYFDGYISESHFIDGQALTPSSFGATNASTGVWQPKAYTGTYGTNGFYLKFSDIATTSGSNAGLGKDFSGNGNYWNTNNISVTSGVTYDAMTDSPTPASATVGNFATWNLLSTATQGGSYTIADGNLKATEASGSTSGYVLSTITMRTGKWYWEVTGISVGSSAEVGIKANTAASLANKNGIAGTSEGFAYRANGNKVTNNSDSAYGASWTNNDVIGVAFDADAGTLTFYKNGTSQGTAFTGIASSEYFAGIGDDSFASNHTLAVNFGQQPFAQSVPSGYKRLETYNLPTPTIGASSTTLANKYFDATLYTGTGSALSVTNAGSFQPDFVWSKDRTTANSHGLYDAVRGVNQRLLSNLTNAEDTSSGVSAFNSNGFSLGTAANYNTNGNSYVAWQWKANGSGSSNTSGSITSTVSVNTTSGFSVVTYTGNGSSGATVGHGLGVKPAMIIQKTRSITNSWKVWHQSLPNANTQLAPNNALPQITLNSTSAYDSAPNDNLKAISSTLVTLGANDQSNPSSGTMVMYCFAEVAGFSKFGSYTGNGSTDGPFVYTGFRPRYVLIKNYSSGGSWVIHDTSRDTYNVTDKTLYPNYSNAESTPDAPFDILSNGFKLRSATLNDSGAGFIYMAFAENPFNYSLAR